MITVTKIFWKRTYLFVEFTAQETVNLVLKNNKKIIFFETKELESGLYRSKLNICIAEGREMLSSGDWRLATEIGKSVCYTEGVLATLENICNVFRYDNDKAYIITAHLLEDDGENLDLKFKVDYMMKNFRPRKRKSSLSIVKYVLNMWYRLICVVFPKKGNRILFMSENKSEMTGNLRAIYDRLFERNLDKDFRICCSIRNIFASKQNPFQWLGVVTKLAVHDFVFVEDYVPVLGFLDIDKRTTIIQTWHAGFGFKSVGYGRFGLEGSPNPYHSCHRKYTYGLIGNDYLRDIYSEVFGIEKKDLLATGMPRLSRFLDEDIICDKKIKMYEELPFLKEKRVITFAPTYRGSNQKDAYYDMSRLDFDRIYKYCEKSGSVFLVKFHPFLDGKVDIDNKYNKYIYDLSAYNLNDLFYITDLLITDYSSCFYDYILLNKPVLFYVYDEAVYSATRGVHRPVSKVAPGKVCHSFEELMLSLETEDYKVIDALDYMIDKCRYDDYMASDKVIDFILLNKRDIDV